MHFQISTISTFLIVVNHFCLKYAVKQWQWLISMNQSKINIVMKLLAEYMNQSKKYFVMTLLAEFYVAYDLLTSPLSSEINQILEILHFRKKYIGSPQLVRFQGGKTNLH